MSRKSNGEFLAESTHEHHVWARLLARELLGIETPSSVKISVSGPSIEMPTELEMDDLSPERLEEVIAEVTRSD